jgi:hypothetical protein
VGQHSVQHLEPSTQPQDLGTALGGLAMDRSWEQPGSRNWSTTGSSTRADPAEVCQLGPETGAQN